MIKVAIIGNFNETKNALISVFNKNQNFYIFDIDKNFNSNILDCSILIINKPLSSKIIYFPNDCTILLNIDNIKKDNIKIFSQNIITYGVNSKSTITFSSIEKINKNKMLFCIQKSIKSFSGNIIYEQEFPVYYNFENLSAVLASVTVGLLNDINFY